MADQNDAKPETASAAVFGGLPIRVDPMVPAGECWFVNAGRRQTVHIHEGQQAGETVEEWLTKPTVYRIVNIGEPIDMTPKMIEWSRNPFGK